MAEIEFHPAMMQLFRLVDIKSKDCFPDLVDGINKIRANYQWSKKTFDETNIGNVYLVRTKDLSLVILNCIGESSIFEAENRLMFLWMTCISLRTFKGKAREWRCFGVS